MHDWLLLIHAAATWFMTGLIWFVQVVHYPLFAGVGRDTWADYGEKHRARTTFIVMPVMLIELAAAGWLAATRTDGLAITGLALLALVWLSTFLVQVPLHARLGAGHDAALMRRLVTTNWLRTIAWTARGVIALLMLTR